MSLTEKKIRASIILEVIGRPAEYLVEALNKIIEDIEKEKGVKIKNSKVNDPVQMKENKEFYSNFAEVEVEVDEILYLAILVFRYMPAHVEVISPQNVSLTNVEWGDVLSEITRKLHSYEEIVRIVQTEKMILEKRLRELLPAEQENLEKDKKEDYENLKKGNNEKKQDSPKKNNPKQDKKEKKKSK